MKKETAVSARVAVDEIVGEDLLVQQKFFISFRSSAFKETKKTVGRGSGKTHLYCQPIP